MNRYLIKLKPLDTFFFSQENKYRKRKLKDNKNTSETIADYFQRSSYFPQQTALLGTLRYCLLQKNGQIPIHNKDDAAKLIGEKSFQAQTGEQNFGKIKSLSAVFLLDQNKKLYFQNPKDLILNENKEMNIKPEYLNKSQQKIENSNCNFLHFDNYVEKTGLSRFLINSEADWLFMNYDKKERPNGVFIEQEKIGITKNERDTQGNRKEKNKDEETGKENFFKQIVYKLNKGFSFGFVAEIDDKDLNNYNSYVSLGAEKSPFRISFEKLGDFKIENEISLKNSNAPKIVLLSDAYLSGYKTDDFLFVISGTKTFRFLKTEVKEGNKYYSSDPLKKQKENMARSRKYNLIESGSVFFFDSEKQMNDLANKLRSEKAESVEKNFYQIGYNNYIMIK